jgi:hypothetical protein
MAQDLFVVHNVTDIGKCRLLIISHQSSVILLSDKHKLIDLAQTAETCSSMK